MQTWQTTRFALPLHRPLVMGIVNATPDSFSDGGMHASAPSALKHCEQLLKDGADILDIGGESTRPGAEPVPLEEELRRVLPILRGAVQLGVPISVDTCKAQVMRAALDAGVDIINDIRALRAPGARAVVAAHPTCGICLMHMHGEPHTMHLSPMAETGMQVMERVRHFLLEQSHALLDMGVARTRIVWDCGIGFGKTRAQNFALLAHQRHLLQDGWPLLAGWSRKRSLGAEGSHPAGRLPASLAAAVLAAARGARVLRVHDVAETAAALAVWQAMEEAASPAPGQDGAT